ncbi:hypothetical protein [Ktedonospora formicarum]|uniref:Uncharacterized protein n=1 Tax=Ktedonospora formicarum TaxID=2778364 RepID=A0A8J3MRX6_9CHLR|nr:hypothetical protein [Ktedonospora formicarum]GHO42755.1 hypothetical protein KSX_09180 [Ktedonospora formicarum]
MSENEAASKYPLSVVRFGMGKEIQLYQDELVVTAPEEDKEVRLPLEELKGLTLVPGDPTPSKLVLMADLTDGETIILAEGMSNAKDFRAMLPQLQELHPELELDPPDMAEQLRQALNSRRAWSLTCYSSIILLCIFLYLLYLAVAFLGAHHP